MSQDEQFIIQGRCLNQYAEVKKLLASLTAKANDMAMALERVVYYIRPLAAPNSYAEPFSGRVPDLDSFPSREQVSELLAEIAQAKDRKRTLQGQLKEYGVEVKD